MFALRPPLEFTRKKQLMNLQSFSTDKQKYTNFWNCKSKIEPLSNDQLLCERAFTKLPDEVALRVLSFAQENRGNISCVSKAWNELNQEKILVNDYKKIVECARKNFPSQIPCRGNINVQNFILSKSGERLMARIRP